MTSATTGEHDERRRAVRWRRPPPLSQGALAPQRPMHHQHPAMPCGANITMAMNRRPKIELPDFRNVAQHHLEITHQRGPEHRTEEIAAAADEGGEQHVAGLRRTEISGVCDLEMDGRKPPATAAKKPDTQNARNANPLISVRRNPATCCSPPSSAAAAISSVRCSGPRW